MAQPRLPRGGCPPNVTKDGISQRSNQEAMGEVVHRAIIALHKSGLYGRVKKRKPLLEKRKIWSLPKSTWET